MSDPTPIPTPSTAQPVAPAPVPTSPLTGAVSTQQQFPLRAVLRTGIAVVVTWVPLLAVALVYLASEKGRPDLPGSWESAIGVAAAWTTFASAGITRAMANPVVDAWLAKIGVSSQPM